MGRTPNSFAADTRRKLVDAAGPLFAAQGMEGVSVREIAGAAKVTGATVLHHFGTKEALYEACIEGMYEQLAALRGEVEEALAGAEDLDAAIEAGVRAVFRIARKNPTAIRLQIRHVVDTGEIMSRPRDKQLLPLLDTGAAIFAARTGRPPEELRLALQSLIFLIGRWSISSTREASASAGVRGAAAWEAVESHLVDVARRLLGGGRTS